MVRIEAEGGLLALTVTAPRLPEDEAAYLAALDRIALHPVPFVLLARFAGHEKLSREADRAQALWFKATRARMNQECRALAMVRPRAAGEKAAEVFGKLWTFPVASFEDEAAARAFLQPYLDTGA
jgi:hypothetical protein